jgi:hypothetical protein
MVNFKDFVTEGIRISSCHFLAAEFAVKRAMCRAERLQFIGAKAWGSFAYVV